MVFFFYSFIYFIVLLTCVCADYQISFVGYILSLFCKNGDSIQVAAKYTYIASSTIEDLAKLPHYSSIPFRRIVAGQLSYIIQVSHKDLLHPHKQWRF